MIFFFRSENNLVKLQEEKERENICYTCDVFQHVKNQLELMTWNWIIPIIPIGLCQNIASFLIVCKKSRESSAMVSATQAVHLVFWRDFLINYKRTLWL